MVDGPYSMKSESRPNDQMAELNTEISICVMAARMPLTYLLFQPNASADAEFYTLTLQYGTKTQEKS